MFAFKKLIMVCLSCLSFSAYMLSELSAQDLVDGLNAEALAAARVSTRTSTMRSCAKAATEKLPLNNMIVSYCTCVAEHIADLPEPEFRMFLRHSIEKSTGKPPTNPDYKTPDRRSECSVAASAVFSSQ